MTDLGRRAENFLVKSVRAVVGFVGSYIFLVYVFLFLGLLRPETELSWPEQKMQSFMFWLTLALACGFGLFTAFYGTINRITSYNVCYTKLLRGARDGLAGLPPDLLSELEARELIEQVANDLADVFIDDKKLPYA